MADEPCLEWFVAMFGNGETYNASLFSINMMAASYSQKLPASPLNGPRQVLYPKWISNCDFHDLAGN
jgi:hypothetical protein